MESMAPSILVTPGELADALGALRASSPLVQCLTNTVVTNFTANVLLAAGGSPAMVDVPGEAGDFASVAAGLLVNLGTPNTEQAAARAAGASVQGVHIGQSDLPAALVRELIGPDAVLGLSAAGEAQIDAANKLQLRSPGTIDYLGVGAVHATPTKKDAPEPLGHAGLARAVAHSDLPVIAIGGIDADDVAPLACSGAAGVAVVRAICAAEDPRAAATNLLNLWEGTKP